MFFDFDELDDVLCCSSNTEGEERTSLVDALSVREEGPVEEPEPNVEGCAIEHSGGIEMASATLVENNQRDYVKEQGKNCLKPLKPFLKSEWTSEKFGMQRVIDVIGDRELRISCDRHDRVLRLEATSLRLHQSVQSVLENAADAFRLMPTESSKTRVVWATPDGTSREVWHRYCPEAVTHVCTQAESEESYDPVSHGEPSGQAKHEEVIVSRWTPRHNFVDLETKFKESLDYGRELMLEKRWEEAELCLLEVKNASKMYRLEAMRERTIVLVALSRSLEAINEATQVQAVDAHSHLTFRNLGLAKRAYGDHQGSAKAYQKALDILGNEWHPHTDHIREGLRLALAASAAQEKASPAPCLAMDMKRYEQPQPIYDATRLRLEEVWERSYGSKVRHLDICAPRHVQMCHETQQWPGGRMSYIVTLPAAHMAGQETEERYPLLVYLHSAGATSICKGDVVTRQVEFVGGEAPHKIVVDRGVAGEVDKFIGVAPCCPPDMSKLYEGGWKSRKVYWFKTSESKAYRDWTFANTKRCREVELLTFEVLAEVCKKLPVDPARIYFYGASAGGYAVLRLAELLCDLPAAIVPMAGYYPVLPSQDHSVENLAKSLQCMHVRLLHCRNDKLCKIDREHVSKAYEVLGKIGIEVEWIDDSVAAGSRKNYHSPHNVIFKNPDAFFGDFLRWTRVSEACSDPVAYLSKCVDASKLR